MNLPDPSRSGDVLFAFLSIVYEGAPYILLGTIISGLIDAFLPAKALEKILPKNRFLATFAAGFLGLIFPVCECAVVPVVRRLVQKGLPISCAMTYLFSAPIINPLVIVSTLTAFKEFQNWESIWDFHLAPMTIARVSLGYAVAVIVGLMLIRKKPSDILTPAVVRGIAVTNPNAPALPSASFDQKLIQSMRTAMRDFLDTAMYFVIGVLITSVFNTQVDQTKVEMVASNEFFAVPSLMGLSFILALCSTSDAFIVAPMGSFSDAAKIAFLVFGPMLDVKLVFMYSAIFARRFLIKISLILFLLVALLCEPWLYAINKWSESRVKASAEQVQKP